MCYSVKDVLNTHCYIKDVLHSVKDVWNTVTCRLSGTQLVSLAAPPDVESAKIRSLRLIRRLLMLEVFVK
jgi:hypothetical protein